MYLSSVSGNPSGYLMALKGDRWRIVYLLSSQGLVVLHVNFSGLQILHIYFLYLGNPSFKDFTMEYKIVDPCFFTNSFTIALAVSMHLWPQNPPYCVVLHSSKQALAYIIERNALVASFSMLPVIENSLLSAWAKMATVGLKKNHFFWDHQGWKRLRYHLLSVNFINW